MTRENAVIDHKGSTVATSPDGSAVSIEVTGLRKRFGTETVAVDGISFKVARGEVVSLLGPSGCGKTTTLRCLAGLEQPDEGIIRLGGRTVFGEGKRSVLPEDRQISMVFQQYALWPHLSVHENVLFGLRARKVSEAEATAKAKRALEMVRLWAVKDRNISQLSGGQQQRIAVARALAYDPEVVLLDEPLSNLDAKLREEMRLELLELQRDLGFTALYVTHDQQEAISLSHRVLVMRDGHIEQAGSPEEIWRAPATPFVAEFIGDTNRLVGRVESASSYQGQRELVTEDALRIPLSTELEPGTPAVAFVRYADLELKKQSPNDVAFSAEAVVKIVSFQGHSTLVKVLAEDTELMVRLPERDSAEFRAGETVWVYCRAPVKSGFAETEV